MSNDNNNDDKVETLKLVEFKTKQQQQEEKLEDDINEAVHSVIEGINLDNTKAIFVVAFDAEGNPNIYFAGSLDPFKMVGVLDTAKVLFQPEIPTGIYMEYEGLDDSEE